MIADGDSITAGLNITPSSNWYPNQGTDPLTELHDLFNVAVPGAESFQTVLRIPTSVGPTLVNYNSSLLAYSLMIGTNDIGHGITPATVYANIQSACASVKSYNPSVHVIVFTVLPAAPYGSEVDRQNLNSLIRSGGSCTYSVADVGNDSTIGQVGQNSNLTYYQPDGIHPTAAGDAIIGLNYLLPALQALGFH